MIAAVKLVREFEVMEDSKDGLGNSHEGWLLSCGNASRCLGNPEREHWVQSRGSRWKRRDSRDAG
jgi:hypothetical protein